MALKSATKRPNTSPIGKRSAITRSKSSASPAAKTHVLAAKRKGRDESEEPDSEGFYDTIVLRVAKPTREKPPTPEATPVPAPSRRDRKREAFEAGSRHDTLNSHSADVTQHEVPLQKWARTSRASARINKLASFSSPSTVPKKDNPPIEVDCVQISAIRRIRPQHDKPRQSRLNPLAASCPDTERDHPDDSPMIIGPDTTVISPLSPHSPRNPAKLDILSLSRDTNSSCKVLSLAKPGVAADRKTQTSDAACADAEYAGSCTLTDACNPDSLHENKNNVGLAGDKKSRGQKSRGSRVAPKKSPEGIVKSTRPVAGANAQDPLNKGRYRLRAGKTQVQYFTLDNEHATATQAQQRRVKGPTKGAPAILLTDESKYAWPEDKMPVGVSLAAEMPSSKHRILRDTDDEKGWRMPKIFHSVTFQEDWAMSCERLSSGTGQFESPVGQQSHSGIFDEPSTYINKAEEPSMAPDNSEEMLDTIVVTPSSQDNPAPINPSRNSTPSLSISSSEVASTIGEWPTSPSLSPTPALAWTNSHDQPRLFMLKDENWPGRSAACDDEMSDVIVVDVMDSAKKLENTFRDDLMDVDGELTQEWGGYDVLLEAAQRMDVAGILAGWRN